MDCQPISDTCKNPAEFVVSTPFDYTGACNWHLPLIVLEAITETGEKSVKVQTLTEFVRAGQ